jgi:hypothetical protein
MIITLAYRVGIIQIALILDARPVPVTGMRWRQTVSLATRYYILIVASAINGGRPQPGPVTLPQEDW